MIRNINKILFKNIIYKLWQINQHLRILINIFMELYIILNVILLDYNILGLVNKLYKKDLEDIERLIRIVLVK